ncbi:MAG: hypothetical protein M0R17_08605 [Candidatus Omnitrophica bacterium]|jgi:hypothetical protein|nr:hypothetical protein [Candidatus Omnitrophota bacterium]
MEWINSKDCDPPMGMPIQFSPGIDMCCSDYVVLKLIKIDFYTHERKSFYDIGYVDEDGSYYHKIGGEIDAEFIDIFWLKE